MKKYAVIHDNKVIDSIYLDKEANPEWVYPFPHDEIVENENNFYKRDWYFEDGKWKEPIYPEVEEENEE
jgi:hypothetical protein